MRAVDLLLRLYRQTLDSISLSRGRVVLILPRLRWKMAHFE